MRENSKAVTRPLAHRVCVCVGVCVCVERTLQVALRATRNCYWSGALWATAIRTSELSGTSPADIGKIRDDALQAGMQVCVVYVCICAYVLS